MDKTIGKITVYQLTSKIIFDLNNHLDTSKGKAQLANLRNSIGKPLSQTVGVWPIIFENLPEEFLSKHGQATYEEKAILNTLQIYALYQQGKSEKTSLEGEDRYWKDLGYSLRNLRRASEETRAIDRRFNAMITATTFEELVYHLRQLIKLLKSKTEAKINYPKLADDLYWYLRGYDEDIKLRWSRRYYANISSKDKGDENYE